MIPEEEEHPKRCDSQGLHSVLFLLKESVCSKYATASFSFSMQHICSVITLSVLVCVTAFVILHTQVDEYIQWMQGKGEQSGTAGWFEILSAAQLYSLCFEVFERRECRSGYYYVKCATGMWCCS